MKVNDFAHYFLMNYQLFLLRLWFLVFCEEKYIMFWFFNIFFVIRMTTDGSIIFFFTFFLCLSGISCLWDRISLIFFFFILRSGSLIRDFTDFLIIFFDFFGVFFFSFIGFFNPNLKLYLIYEKYVFVCFWHFCPFSFNLQ